MQRKTSYENGDCSTKFGLRHDPHSDVRHMIGCIDVAMKEIGLLVAALLVDICFGVTICKLRLDQQGLVACMLLSIIEN